MLLIMVTESQVSRFIILISFGIYLSYLSQFNQMVTILAAFDS